MDTVGGSEYGTSWSWGFRSFCEIRHKGHSQDGGASPRGRVPSSSGARLFPTPPSDTGSILPTGLQEGGLSRPLTHGVGEIVVARRISEGRGHPVALEQLVKPRCLPLH